MYHKSVMVRFYAADDDDYQPSGIDDFKIQTAWKTLWKKVKLLILSNFTYFPNAFLDFFSLVY